MDDLKIYCETMEDQSDVFDFIFITCPGAKISTWEPDGDDENPGTWGMFVDNVPENLWDKIIDEFEDCFDFEMAIGPGDREYP